ncbi:unnamed protein product [Phytophthora fragariaefolia]|uniref:Unnamed protein product n=1 Tax=Phytophthora fragariaefolia TaxID=1490495 RepID=A0A9W6XVQ6_9STRA|nr:unnamed protein product [Phytophthora fragariaefolia]
MSVIFGVETSVTTPVSTQRLCTQPRAGVTIPGIATGNKNLRLPAGAGPPAGDAVERVDIGRAVVKTSAPTESRSHSRQHGKPNQERGLFVHWWTVARRTASFDCRA